MVSPWALRTVVAVHLFVAAHVFGHTDFFKNNAYFSNTSRRMIDKVSIHAERIAKYEFDHGKEEVERFLDAALSIQEHVDYNLLLRDDEGPKEEKSKPLTNEYDDLWGLEKKAQRAEEERERSNPHPPKFPEKPEKDLLLFLTRHAPHLLPWQRDILEHIEALGLGYVSISGHTTSVSIGLQYGPIWAGTIGISRRFGPTLIGDAVNVATRLEQQARRLDAQVVVGNEVIQRARQESGSHAAELEQFVNVGPLFVHGRPSPVHVWKLPTQSTEVLPDVDAEAQPQPQPGNRAARS